MPTTLLRTVLLYLLIVGAMKIMGKRQIGQMQLSELVTVTLLSELASYAILDTDIPIIYSVAPIFVLICIEVTISFLSLKCRKLSRLFDGNPAYIIYKGEIIQKELTSSRLTMTEVISEIRAAGYSSISEIYYMILEPSGKVSVIPKCTEKPMTPALSGVKAVEVGIDHAIIFDGTVIPERLSEIKRDDSWLLKQLRSKGIKSVSDCFYFAINDNGEVTAVKKDKGNGSS